MRRHGLLGMAAIACATQPVAAQLRGDAVEEVLIDRLQERMRAGSLTSVAVTRAYLARIEAIDRRGPTRNSPVAGRYRRSLG